MRLLVPTCRTCATHLLNYTPVPHLSLSAASRWAHMGHLAGSSPFLSLLFYFFIDSFSLTSVTLSTGFSPRPQPTPQHFQPTGRPVWPPQSNPAPSAKAHSDISRLPEPTHTKKMADRRRGGGVQTKNWTTGASIRRERKEKNVLKACN